MTTEKVRELHQARPFRPFTLHLADGRRVRVVSPEFMNFSPSDRLAHVFHDDDRSEFFDHLLVLSVELGNGRKRRSKR
ncbi:MAG: hypothetical protein C4547_01035 [Phycisphaerales bacterium]|nr:MAG: hypothetical protein C4547_01035 [Phycisphaerales bacterium]